MLAVGVTASVLAPTKWGTGYKLYGSYWDMMGEYVLNGTYSNITINPVNTSAYAIAIVTFNGTIINYNKTVNVSLETYQFRNNSAGYRVVNLSANQTANYSCSQFVTEINVNSSNVTASACNSTNATTLTSKWLGTPSNSYTVTDNETNITVTASFTGGANYSHSYVDVIENYDLNASTGDMIFRSKNATGTLTERFRIKEYVASGNGFIISEITLPTSRAVTPVNGSTNLNLTLNKLEVYSNGAWRDMNGTAI